MIRPNEIWEALVEKEFNKPKNKARRTWDYKRLLIYGESTPRSYFKRAWNSLKSKGGDSK